MIVRIRMKRFMTGTLPSLAALYRGPLGGNHTLMSILREGS
jgi:hypothetical protein